MRRRTLRPRRIGRKRLAIFAASMLVAGGLSAREAPGAVLVRTWVGGPGDWNVDANWNPTGAPNNTNNGGGDTYNVFIDGGNAVSSLVNLTTAVTVSNLTIDSDDTLAIRIGAALTISTAGAGGALVNAGIISLNAAGGVTSALLTSGSVTLSGGGTVNLAGDPLSLNKILDVAVNSPDTFTNVNNEIHGSGQIGGNTFGLANQAAGKIFADNGGQTLTIQTDTVGATNAGTIQASGGGILAITGTLMNNTGGTIQSLAGSTVTIATSTITGGTVQTVGTGTLALTGSGQVVGGTLTNAATGMIAVSGLSNAIGGAVTNAGAINVGKAAELFLQGGAGNSYNNTGTITLNASGGSVSDLIVRGGGATLSGGGSVVLSNDPFALNRVYGGTGTERLTNADNTIRGAGQIGVGLMALTNGAAGTIDADLNGRSITVDLTTGTGVNQGTMQASNGGTLTITGSGAFNNAGGTIQAEAGSTVAISTTTINGGTVQTVGTGAIDLNGGGQIIATLTNSPTGSIAVTSGTNLIGGAVTNAGSISIANGATLTLQAGSYANSGTISLNAGGGTVSDLTAAGNVTLNGGGSVVLSNDPNALNRIGGAAGDILTNTDNTIRGAGQIGLGVISLVNGPAGTIDADLNGRSITVAVATGTGVNQGTIQASNGGTLAITGGGAFNNAGGTIQAETGSTVMISTTTINGGTVRTVGVSAINLTGSAQILASLTNNASGSLVVTGTGNAIGGTVTNAGAIIVGSASSLALQGGGTFTNTGTISLNASGGSVSDLIVRGGDATLSGGGIVQLSNDPNALNRIYGGAGTETLTNANNTIQGTGQIGTGHLGFVNDGTVIARGAAGITISANALGTTNNGVFQVNTGSTLTVTGLFNNFASNTLTGGAYQVFGTFKFDNAAIQTNAATIVLDGAGSAILDQNRADGLAGFATNAAAGSFTIKDGRNFTSGGAFANAGAVDVAAGTTFKLGASGTADYTQSAGSSIIDGTLTVGNAVINGGSVSGRGTIAGNLANNGSVSPGDGAPGTLSVLGDYAQTASGVLNLAINGTGAGQFSVLSIGGVASLDGLLNVVFGAGAAAGDTYNVMTYGSETGSYNPANISVTGLGAGLILTEAYHGTSLTLLVTTTAVPEPGSIVLLGLGLAGAGVWGLGRRRAAAAARSDESASEGATG